MLQSFLGFQSSPGKTSSAYLLAALLFFSVFHARADSNTAADIDTATNIVADVVYGHKDGMALFYDVISPEKPNGAGVVFMVSGGWFSVWQPPQQRLKMFRPLLSAGFTVFTVHHGSAPRYKVTEALSDVRAAVRHIRGSANRYSVEADRLGVFGGSAGGHLSLMLGLDAQSPPRSGGQGIRMLKPSYAAATTDSAQVAAIAAYFPPVDLRNIVGPNKRFPALDIPKTQAPSISPLLFVDPSDPPTLLIHGDKDDLVPLSESQNIKAELDKQSVKNKLIVIEGGDHGFKNPVHRQQAMTAVVAWFTTHLLRL